MLTSKAFSDIVTFSRSSNATRIGPTGRVEYAPHNLILQSQTFDNGYWSTGSATITANTVAAPDGTVTADTLTTSSAFGGVYNSNSVTSGLVYTWSIYAKAGTGSVIRLDCNATSSICVGQFDLSAGTSSVVGGSGSTTIQSVGNGWYRCSVTATATASGSGAVVVQNSTISYVYLWGAQLSVGPYPLDYTPTTSAAVYGPRFDYDPVTLAARGLLVEEQRTNLFTYSEQFDNPAWSQQRSSITANAATSPDGTVTADQSTIDNTNGFHDALLKTFASTSGTLYTLSFFVKKNVGIEAVYFYTDANTSGAVAKFNLTTGAYIGNASANGYVAFTSYSSTALSNGWYRITATVTANTTTATAFFALGMSTNTNDTVTAFTGNGTDNFYLWGAQLEAGSFATSYIPTLASSVTRSADVASVNTLSPFYNATEGTLFAEASTLGYNPGRLVSLSDSPGSASTVQSINFETSGATRVYQVSGSLNFDFAPGSYTPNAIVKIAGRFKASNYAAAQNGGAVSTSSNAISPPTMTYMALGALTSNSFYLNGHLRRVAYYPRALTNAELQSLTA